MNTNAVAFKQAQIGLCARTARRRVSTLLHVLAVSEYHRPHSDEALEPEHQGGDDMINNRWPDGIQNGHSLSHYTRSDKQIVSRLYSPSWGMDGHDWRVSPFFMPLIVLRLKTTAHALRRAV